MEDKSSIRAKMMENHNGNQEQSWSQRVSDLTSQKENVCIDLYITNQTYQNHRLHQPVFNITKAQTVWICIGLENKRMYHGSHPVC